ncbi:MAG: tyrosine--tRNA ligase [Bacteroidetes bacterium]|jgi:tyrosyl-tRNA synthetase|nr:tyrosine--tRNA ligase [Bacteroidota bacterium]
MPTFPPIDEQLTQIRRGVEDIVPEDDLVDKLKQSREAGTPLVVKLGCDPSRPDLHLGHAVVLRKLRQFQDLGHQAVLIVGDFTGMIGDPSGRSKTRPPLTFEETRRNGETYFEQASKILDPERTRIVYNSEWLDQMTFSEVIELAGKYTVARMLERDDFEKRYKAGEAIGVHEFLYPLAQAQDSVAIQSDIELGGTDQRFNLLVGRSIQQANGMAPQVCIMLPLLEGTDGAEKMSKSLDNYIGIDEAPEEMYGKTLSIPDELIYRYFELATDVPTAELPRLKTYAEDDPRNAKHDLAFAIVQMYHGEEAAKAARQHFEKTVVQGDVPDDIETFHPEPDEGTVIGLLNLMKQAGLTQSNSQGRRMVKQNAVSIDGEKVSDPYLDVDLAAQAPFVLKVGKRRYAQIVWDDA